MRATLRRFADSPFGTFGFLDVYDDAGTRLLRLATLEDDWLNNAPRVSCIPAGTYSCHRDTYHKTGEATFEIRGVPNRSRILFHAANTEEHVEGCVGLGMDFGALSVRDEDATGEPARTKWAVVDSRAAFALFMRTLQGIVAFPLVVEWAAPGSWR
jgi:hypothetical protein